MSQSYSMAFCTMLRCQLALLLLVKVSYVQSVAPSQKRLDAWTKSVQNYLTTSTSSKFSALELFQQTYKGLDPDFSILNLDDIIREKAKEFGEVLKLKEGIVRRIAIKAQELRDPELPNLTQDDVWFYKLKEDLLNPPPNDTTATKSKVKPIHYHNAKCRCGYQINNVAPEEIEDQVECFEPYIGFQPSKRFKGKKVSYEETSVHIATEVYNGGDDVLRDIYLSDQLFDIFFHELCNISNLHSISTKWLYFTTKEGVTRYFPGKPRVVDDCTVPDVYDRRISPWYLQSSSSPKDIVMLVDNSGSVEGLTLNLIRRSVKHVLDTLTPNDFVNVILFNTEVTYVLGKCQDLLQATPANKQFLLDGLEEFAIGNRSNFETGFEAAFKMIDGKLLNNNEVPHSGCNPVVLLFTDGGAEYPEEAVNNYNWDKHHAKRVFTFAVGKNFYETYSVRDIACKNRGVFHRVPSFGATKEETQQYLIKIAKPMVYKNDKSAKWTLPYSDANGLGRVMSVSVPVYENSNNDNNGFVGVVGADILVEDFKHVLYSEKMGQDFYIFGVDNNGFTFIHPKLKEPEHDEVQTVDITELESNEIENVRENMVDQIRGRQTVMKQMFYDGNKYSYKAPFLYSYTRVDGTIFSVAATAHESKTSSINTRQTLLNANLSNLKVTDIANKNDDILSILYNDPCPEKISNYSDVCFYDEPNITKNAVNYSRGIDLLSYNKTCNSALYYDMLLHGWVSNEVIRRSWVPSLSNATHEGVVGLIFASETPSLLKIFPTNQEYSKNLVSTLRSPATQPYYQRTVHAPDYGWIFSFVKGSQDIEDLLQYEVTTQSTTQTSTEFPQTTDSTIAMDAFTTPAGVTIETNDIVIATRAVQPFPEHPMLTPVVVGAAFNSSHLQLEVFKLLTHECQQSKLCSSDMQIDCAMTDVTTCLVVDDGGYLIFSNQFDHQSIEQRFIGYLDGDLTRSLVKAGIYKVAKYTDTQTLCTNTGEDEPNAAGFRTLYIPGIIDMLNFGWWASTSAFVFLHTVVQTMIAVAISCVNVSLGHTEKPDLQQTQGKIVNKPEFCIRESNVLHYGSVIYYHDKMVKCNEVCNRSYSTMRISNTNLLIIVADKGEGCLSECIKSPPYENQPVIVDSQDTCGNSNYTNKYRGKPAGECYDTRNINAADDTYCSSSSLTICRNLIFLCLLISLLLH